jgi:hypothetical protein
MKPTLVALLTLSCLCPWTQAAPAAAGQPNVLIVLPDDQGMGDFSC